jgi:hypothetical protein
MKDAQAKDLALMYEESLTTRADQEYAMAILKLDNQRLKDEIYAYAVVRGPIAAPHCPETFNASIVCCPDILFRVLRAQFQEQNTALQEALSILHKQVNDYE